MDDWSKLLEELRWNLSYVRPTDLLIIIADYVRARRHEFTAAVVCLKTIQIVGSTVTAGPSPTNTADASNWIINGNVAEKSAADQTGYSVLTSIYDVSNGPTSWTIDVDSAGADFGHVRAIIGVTDGRSDRSLSEFVYQPYADGRVPTSASCKFGKRFRIRIAVDVDKQTVTAQFLNARRGRLVSKRLDRFRLYDPIDFGRLRPYCELLEYGTIFIT